MKLYEQGLSDAQIAEQVNMSKSGILKWRNANSLPPNGSSGRERSWCVEEAMRFYKQGYNDREVGEQLGTGYWVIGDWRRGQGLPANGKRRVSR